MRFVFLISFLLLLACEKTTPIPLATNQSAKEWDFDSVGAENVLVSGSNQGEIKLWNSNTGEYLGDLLGASNVITALALNDTRIVAGDSLGALPSRENQGSYIKHLLHAQRLQKNLFVYRQNHMSVWCKVYSKVKLLEEEFLFVFLHKANKSFS